NVLGIAQGDGGESNREPLRAGGNDEPFLLTRGLTRRVRDGPDAHPDRRVLEGQGRGGIDDGGAVERWKPESSGGIHHSWTSAALGIDESGLWPVQDRRDPRGAAV